MEPEGSAGVKADIHSQQMRGVMVHELLEVWPIEALREAGKDKADIKRSALGCQVLKRKREAGEAVAENSPAVLDSGSPAGLVRQEALDSFCVAKRRWKNHL